MDSSEEFVRAAEKKAWELNKARQQEQALNLMFAKLSQQIDNVAQAEYELRQLRANHNAEGELVARSAMAYRKAEQEMFGTLRSIIKTKREGME